MADTVMPDSRVTMAGDAPPENDYRAEQAEVELVLKLWNDGKDEDAEKDLGLREDFYKGKQWEGGVKKPVVNICRATIQGTLPIMTDSRPGFNVLAKEPSDYEFATTLSSVVDSWWQKPERGLDHTIVEVLTDSQIGDFGTFKVWWDDEADNGTGDICAERVAQKDIRFNKEATDFNKGCTWIIHRTFKTVGALKRKFQDKAANIHADSKKDDKSESLSTEVTLVSPTDQKWPVPRQPSLGESDSRDMCEVFECWMDSEELEDYREERDGKVEEGTKRKFPGGKLVTVLPNQKILLQSIGNPYKHGLKPFIRIVDTLLPGKLKGEGEIEPLMEMQKVLNKSFDNIVRYMTLMSNPTWLNQRDSGVNSNDITNDVALVIEVDDINKIKRDIPPALPPAALELPQMVMRISEIISGINDVSQGRKPAGIQAGVAIEALQEAAQTRIRLKDRNLEVSLAQMGSQVIQLIFQYYTSPRVIRITGNENWPQYFEFYIQNTEQGYVMNRKRHMPQPETGKYVPETGFSQIGPSKGVFDIKVQSGTSLPFAKEQRMNLSMQLRKQGDLSREGLYEALEWPNSQEELQRMAKQEAQQAQAAQQAAMMKGVK
jgi:hypothetical protein